MGSHSVTSLPTQVKTSGLNPSQTAETGRFSINLAREVDMNQNLLQFDKSNATAADHCYHHLQLQHLCYHPNCECHYHTNQKPSTIAISLNH